MNKVVEILKALFDTTHLRVLMFIKCGEVCVYQATELLQLALSTISKHILKLIHAGLIGEEFNSPILCIVKTSKFPAHPIGRGSFGVIPRMVYIENNLNDRKYFI